MHEKAHRYQRVQKMDALFSHTNRIDRHDHDAIKRAKYAKSGVSGRQALMPMRVLLPVLQA